jgi:hypothetical protein
MRSMRVEIIWCGGQCGSKSKSKLIEAKTLWLPVSLQKQQHCIWITVITVCVCVCDYCVFFRVHAPYGDDAPFYHLSSEGCDERLRFGTKEMRA